MRARVTESRGLAEQTQRLRVVLLDALARLVRAAEARHRLAVARLERQDLAQGAHGVRLAPREARGRAFQRVPRRAKLQLRGGGGRVFLRRRRTRVGIARATRPGRIGGVQEQTLLAELVLRRLQRDRRVARAGRREQQQERRREREAHRMPRPPHAPSAPRSLTDQSNITGFRTSHVRSMHDTLDRVLRNEKMNVAYKSRPRLTRRRSPRRSRPRSPRAPKRDSRPRPRRPRPSSALVCARPARRRREPQIAARPTSRT